MANRFSILELFRDGVLGGARAGMSRAEIRATLGPPDDWMVADGDGDGQSSPIWRYGNFEIHFEGECSWMLFSDCLDALQAGPDRVLDPWILVGGELPTLEQVVESLRERECAATLWRDRLNRPVLRRDGGAQLTFDPIDWSDIDPDPLKDDAHPRCRGCVIAAYAPGFEPPLTPY